MSALVAAIPAIALRTGRDVVVIGGLAVVCRLSRPYRATTDLDIVHVASLPTDPTDRLHVMAHAWAAATATQVTIRAGGPR